MKQLQTKLLSSLFILASSCAFSQFQFGAKIGGGLSNTTVVHGISKERIGLLGGLVGKYQLSSRTEDHYIQAEILYTNQGEYSVDRSGNKYKAFVDYLNIPIMYKFYFDDQGSDFFLEAGPQVGFVISDKIDPLGPEAQNNDLKAFDLAFNVGVGYSYNRTFEANIRYGIGLVDTYGYKKWENDINRTSFLTLGLTYFFN
ncbi:porin family protein [Faecalibacter sp. LW9]|uniref:porin family protein n=1 Tax=Faecalibacter sp. LW9 TaxID=3103144 RepID=UPI002AFE4A04|nr:porin family protein [Faecalibacter sp. LW9]